MTTTPFAPVPRAAPAPISSGISFRELPAPSIDQIIQTCKHYEQKCSGKYSSAVPSARYLFQLSREVQTQALVVRNHQVYSHRRLRELKATLEKWKTVFQTNETSDSIFELYQEQQATLKQQKEMIQMLQAEAGEGSMEQGLTTDEREKIQVETIMLKNEEIDALKDQHRKELLLLEQKMQDQQEKAIEALKKQQSTPEESQSLAQKQTEDELNTSKLLQQAAEQKSKRLDQENQRLMAELEMLKLANDEKIQTLQTEARLKVNDMQQSLEQMVLAHQVELKQFAVAKRKELETTHAREVFQCKSTRRENDYLKKRVVELERIMKSLQFALQGEKDEGKTISATTKTAESYFYPFVTTN